MQCYATPCYANKRATEQLIGSLGSGDRTGLAGRARPEGPGRAGRAGLVGGRVSRVRGRGSHGRRPKAPFLLKLRGSAGRARDPWRTNNNNNDNNNKNSDSKVPRSRLGAPPLTLTSTGTSVTWEIQNGSP